MSGVALDLVEGVGCGACRALLVALQALAQEGDDTFTGQYSPPHYSKANFDPKTTLRDICLGLHRPECTCEPVHADSCSRVLADTKGRCLCRRCGVADGNLGPRPALHKYLVYCGGSVVHGGVRDMR